MALTLLLATTPGAEAQSAPAASSDSTVPEVVVTGQKEVAREGTTEDGYRTTSASLGPLGKAPLKDIPYSIRAVSSDLPLMLVEARIVANEVTILDAQLDDVDYAALEAKVREWAPDVVPGFTFTQLFII